MGPSFEMSVRSRIPQDKEDDSTVWLINAPIVTNCGAASASKPMRSVSGANERFPPTCDSRSGGRLRSRRF